MDISQYLEIFIDESNEHLQNLNTQIEPGVGPGEYGYDQ